MTIEIENTQPKADDRPLLRAIEAVDLFGRYSYWIDLPDVTTGRLILLHGDNGSGKTTILKLLWNLLSHSSQRDHHTFIARTPFRRFTVHFTDGSALVATKLEDLTGAFTLTVHRRSLGEITAQYHTDERMVVSKPLWSPHELNELQILESEDDLDQGVLFDDRPDIQLAVGQAQIFNFLAAMDVNPLLLADDRGVYSDDVELGRLRERMVGLERHRGAPAGSDEVVARELRITLRRVNDWLRTLTLGGQNTGSAGANTIYSNVLRQLAKPSAQQADVVSSGAETIVDHLADLASKSPRFEEFGLVPHFAADDFLELLNSIRTPDRLTLARNIIGPFLESLTARYEALEDAERVLRTLTSLINGFLVDKSLTFNPRNGLTISTTDGVTLDPGSLSSGERQLTMLLCTTILASRDSRLLIIDEPELSLGVRWQREILDALLELTEGTRLQFVVATHSIEIISAQRGALVTLSRQV